LHFHFWQRWQGYAVNAIPTLVKDYRLVAALAEGTEVIVADVRNNYQRGAMRRLTSPSHFCYNVFMVAGGTGTLGASMRIVSFARGNNTRSQRAGCRVGSSSRACQLAED